MKELKPGTLVIMVKNEDNSFSPIAMSKEQAYIINAFISKLSEDEPLGASTKNKYIEAE